MELDQAIGSPVRTITLKGKPIKLVPLTLNDHAEFARHMRHQRIEDFKEASVGLNDAVKATHIREILKENMLDSITTMEGVRYLFFLSARHNQTIAVEDAGAMVGQNDLEEILGIITETELDEPSNPQIAEEGNP